MSAVNDTIDLEAPSSVAAGATKKTTGLGPMTFFLAGNGTYSAKIQISATGLANDWADLAAAAAVTPTAGAFFTLETPAPFARVSVTIYASGTPKVLSVGRLSQG